MSEKETPLPNTERLPELYYNNINNNNNQNIHKQTIEERNKVIDDYLNSLEQIGVKKNEISSSSEDEKDPFSSKALKNLKPLKKSSNKLILPNFRKKLDIKNEIDKRNNTSMPKNKIIEENISKKTKKMTRNKNLSDNNMLQKIVEGKLQYMNKPINANKKNNKNAKSKWTISSNTFNEYISFSKKNKNCNLYKNKNINEIKFSHINNSLNYKALMQSQLRSKSHMKNSYNLYKDKINSFLKNKTINNYYNKLLDDKKGKNITNKQVIIPYNNAENSNLYMNIIKNEKNKRRNFTAKIIKKKIELSEKMKKNKNLVNSRINSTLNNNHQKYEKLIKEKNNPYGLVWVNKILKINNGKLGLSKEFINGVPIVKIIGKNSLTKRETKKRLCDMEKMRKIEENKYIKLINAEPKLNERNLDDEYNLPNEIMEQFNRNTKNFFKVRKDIIEQPDEEENFMEH